MTRYALIDAEDAFTGRIEDFSEAPELAANKGRWVLYVTADQDPATQVLDPPALSEDGSALLHLPRTKSADEVAAMRVAVLDRIKAEARRRILALYPEWKQANMTARGVELTRIASERTWTADETAEADVLQAAWDGIKALRAQSDALEATVPADAAGIAAFDPTQGWDT